MNKKAILEVSTLPDYDVEIGRWLWCLEDVRHDLLKRLSGIDNSLLDRKIGERQSIGTLLYHIAYVEAGWLYGEVMGRTDMDTEIEALFPLEGWTDDKLTHFEGESIDNHFYRLNKVREVLLSYFRSMNIEDWRTPRVLEEYDVTPEWVIYHLIDHESNHRGQIFQLLRGLRDAEV